jgi:hypothetical protein
MFNPFVKFFFFSIDKMDEKKNILWASFSELIPLGEQCPHEGGD